MIPRYSCPDMVAIWSPETKFRIWYEIEAHACDAMADLGVIPRENAEAVWKARDTDFDVTRIDEIEAVTKHDVIAFLTHLAEIIGADAARCLGEASPRLVAQLRLELRLRLAAGARQRAVGVGGQVEHMHLEAATAHSRVLIQPFWPLVRRVVSKGVHRQSAQPRWKSFDSDLAT